MPALTALAIAAAVRARLSLKRFFERLRNRHDAMRLAALDDRMLADIGLNRSDLRDAFAELPWRDPSEVLMRRAAERRTAGMHAPFAMPSECYPPTSRPARYSV